MVKVDKPQALWARNLYTQDRSTDTGSFVVNSLFIVAPRVLCLVVVLLNSACCPF